MALVLHSGSKRVMDNPDFSDDDNASSIRKVRLVPSERDAELERRLEQVTEEKQSLAQQLRQAQRVAEARGDIISGLQAAFQAGGVVEDIASQLQTSRPIDESSKSTATYEAKLREANSREIKQQKIIASYKNAIESLKAKHDKTQKNLQGAERELKESKSQSHQQHIARNKETHLYLMEVRKKLLTIAHLAHIAPLQLPHENSFKAQDGVNHLLAAMVDFFTTQGKSLTSPTDDDDGLCTKFGNMSLPEDVSGQRPMAHMEVDPASVAYDAQSQRTEIHEYRIALLQSELARVEKDRNDDNRAFQEAAQFHEKRHSTEIQEKIELAHRVEMLQHELEQELIFRQNVATSYEQKIHEIEEKAFGLEKEKEDLLKRVSFLHDAVITHDQKIKDAESTISGLEERKSGLEHEVELHLDVARDQRNARWEVRAGIPEASNQSVREAERCVAVHTWDIIFIAGGKNATREIQSLTSVIEQQKQDAKEAAELADEREQEKVRLREEIEVLREAAETNHTRVEMADAKVLEMESQQS
ncbi:hypothetical protein FB107DRAFT_280283, partial [Schizophyllum commune]